MNLYFITGSENKFSEFQAHIPQLKMLKLDLPEVQSLDPHDVISHKLREAKKHYSGDLMVEDTSFYLHCLNGMPGPLIKWFLSSLGTKGLHELAERYGDVFAKAITMIGLERNGSIHYFEGLTEGMVVAPRGPDNFGWDTIFIPAGYNQTYAELGSSVKDSISMRHKALVKLNNFLQEN